MKASLVVASAVVLAACAKPDLPAAKPAPANLAASGPELPPVRLIVSGNDNARIVTAAGGRVTEQRVTVPGSVAKVAWGKGDGPVLQLDTGVVSRVTARGLEELPRVTSKQWKFGEVQPDQPDVFADPSGAIWLSICTSRDDFNDACDRERSARIDPQPLVVTDDDVAHASFPTPTIAAPAAPPIKLVEPAPGSDRPPTLQCVRDGRALQAEDADYWIIGAAIIWIASDPPIFTVEVNNPSDHHQEQLLFLYEGCTRVEGHVTQGPSGYFIISDGLTTSLRWRGREIAKWTDVDQFAFAPE